MEALEMLADRATEICTINEWDRDWQSGGVYLHLEVSELIEALRGKSGDPVDEAGDVLFVWLSLVRAHGMAVQDIVRSLENKMDLIATHGRSYKTRGQHV